MVKIENYMQPNFTVDELLNLNSHATQALKVTFGNGGKLQDMYSA